MVETLQLEALSGDAKSDKLRSINSATSLAWAADLPTILLRTQDPDGDTELIRAQRKLKVGEILFNDASWSRIDRRL